MGRRFRSAILSLVRLPSISTFSLIKSWFPADLCFSCLLVSSFIYSNGSRRGLAESLKGTRILDENLTKRSEQMAQKYFKANLPKLENLRIARGWSREQLASKAILSTRTLDSIMAGKSAVLSTFSKLAKALETPVNAIVDGFEDASGTGERCWTVTINISAPYNEFDETKGIA